MVNLNNLYEGQRRRLQKAVAQRVYQLTKNKNEHPVLFKAIHSAIKERFKVNTYHDIEQSEFQKVLRFIENWK